MKERKSNVIREKVIISKPQFEELKEIDEIARAYGLRAIIMIGHNYKATYALVEDVELDEKASLYKNFHNKLEVITFLAKRNMKSAGI